MLQKFRKPRKPIFWKMLKKIERIKMEFGQDDEACLDLARDLEHNTERLRAQLHSSSDLVIRKFQISIYQHSFEAALVFIDGLIDKQQLEWSVLQPLMNPGGEAKTLPDNLLEFLKDRLITVGDIAEQVSLQQLIDSLLVGGTVLLIQGYTTSLVLKTPGWDKRSVEQPESEANVRGPREGFVESMRVNTAMLRRKIGHPDLTFETLTIGYRSKTDVSLVFIHGLTSEKLLAEVRKRLQKIDTDIIVGAGGVEQFVEDAPLSIFSTVGYTERPEVVATKIVEGRVAIIVEGTPVVLTVPFLLVENFQFPDDYNFGYVYSTLLRWIRYGAFFVTLIGPAFFVALTTFHQELIPTPLLISMAAATEGTPFPTVIEVIAMGFVFELIREGGIRLPKPIGQAIGIVGALVIGQATVQAGLVGAPTVIVVATTAVASFVIPALVDETTPLRIIFVIIAGVLGAFGIVMGLILLLIHLAALRSFGVPFLSPIVPTTLRELGQDVLLRAPWWMMSKRPRMLNANDSGRQADEQKPTPPKAKGDRK